MPLPLTQGWIAWKMSRIYVVVKKCVCYNHYFTCTTTDAKGKAFALY